MLKKQFQNLDDLFQAIEDQLGEGIWNKLLQSNKYFGPRKHKLIQDSGGLKKVLTGNFSNQENAKIGGDALSHVIRNLNHILYERNLSDYCITIECYRMSFKENNPNITFPKPYSFRHPLFYEPPEDSNFLANLIIEASNRINPNAVPYVKPEKKEDVKADLEGIVYIQNEAVLAALRYYLDQHPGKQLHLQNNVGETLAVFSSRPQP